MEKDRSGLQWQARDREEVNRSRRWKPQTLVCTWLRAEMGEGQMSEGDHPLVWNRLSLGCSGDMATSGKPSLATQA